MIGRDRLGSLGILGRFGVDLKESQESQGAPEASYNWKCPEVVGLPKDRLRHDVAIESLTGCPGVSRTQDQQICEGAFLGLLRKLYR